MEFPNVEWITQSGHPASGTRLQFAEVNAWPGDPDFVPGEFARVIDHNDDDTVIFGPTRNTVEATREYQRRVDQFVKVNERQGDTYADYELAKIDKSQNVLVKFRDRADGSTRWMVVRPATMAKIAAILRESPENQ
jgi:hypothetical protein